MTTKILRFIGLLAGMAIVTAYIPFGVLISSAIVFIALWKFVNSKEG